MGFVIWIWYIQNQEETKFFNAAKKFQGTAVTDYSH